MSDWEERYRQGAFPATPHPLVLRAAELAGPGLAPGLALDVACGAGRHALALAAGGWRVTAVDQSAAGLAHLQTQAAAQGLAVHTVQADLAAGAFVIAPAAYDLIVVTCYLQRDLFPAMRAGVRPGGLAVAVIALADDDPAVKPMNPAFLLQTGELRAAFAGWELLHDAESKAGAGQRAMAELIARKLTPDD